MDIDIDFFSRDAALQTFEHTLASRETPDGIRPHNSGVYVTKIPTDYRTNLATVNYKDAEERGYFKIDFLNVGVYDGVTSEEHLVRLMEAEPVWELLEHVEFVQLLFHLSSHAHLVAQMKPKSVDHLAAFLAIIRPGKRHLIGRPWDVVLKEAWAKPADGSFAFKKSHSYAYAMAIVVQMNLLSGIE